MNTLLLDVTQWDLVVDISGNIAAASNPYSQAQDSASQIKTFQGEVYYNTQLGLPYFTRILGHSPPLALLKQYFVNAALLVPGIVSAVCYVTSFVNRTFSGQIQITNDAGNTSASSF